MASLDFEIEQTSFRDYWNEHHEMLEQGKDTLVAIIKALISDKYVISSVFGRIKDREESIKKFSLKYQSILEENKSEYEIKNHITDLIGIRIVCLYEVDVKEIKNLLSSEFEVIEVTDKITDRESKEDSFGYKGLHIDLKLKAPRITMPEYSRYADLRFEVQIRTIIQDAWSVLDHRIKYKKSIPIHLKRRINTLAALFELADREFYSIKNETEQSKENAKQAISAPSTTEPLDVFSFLAIVENNFPDYNFLSYKADGFVSEILLYKEITPQKLKQLIEDNIVMIREYKTYLEKDTVAPHTMNPYTQIRHLLYKADKLVYGKILYNAQQMKFSEWLKKKELLVDKSAAKK